MVKGTLSVPVVEAAAGAPEDVFGSVPEVSVGPVNMLGVTIIVAVGMDPVDESDVKVEYSIDIAMTSPSSRVCRPADRAARTRRFEIWITMAKLSKDASLRITSN